MSSSDITRACPASLDGPDQWPASSASLFLPLPNGLSLHGQAEVEVEEDKFESRISLVEILHCLQDAAEQRNAEDRPSSPARLIRTGLTG
jgi:hypothetical protein